MKKSMRLTRFPKITPWMIWVGIMGGMIVAGVFAGWMVFTKGLVVTNLTDRVRWGLWITLDLSSIAISAGAFSLFATVYLLGLKKFQPVARTATFIGLIGYSMALLSQIAITICITKSTTECVKKIT